MRCVRAGLRRRLRLGLGLASWLSALALAGPAAAQTANATLWWRSPATPEVQWRGMQGTEGGVVSGNAMLYPGMFGLVGLFAAIATHAAISGGVQSAEERRKQEEADKVLAPYADVLKAWPAQALWQAAAAAALAPPASTEIRIVDATATAGAGVALEVAPVFTLAQDEGVLVLDAAIKLTPPPGATPVQAVVRVVSSPHDAADARAHWSADDAKRLKDTAAAMLAHALQVAARHATLPNAALAAASRPEAAPARTHRYLQGSVERSERAQQIEGDCDRAVLRNLRGWLLSVPLRAAEGTECKRSSPF